MKDQRRYSRVYHEAVDDPRFASVWGSDPALALWVRLLCLADAAWPSSCPVPRSTKAKPLAVLADAGLVELLPGDLFRIHGLDPERQRRRESSLHANAVRWHSGEESGSESGSESDGHSGSDPRTRTRTRTRTSTRVSKSRYRIPRDPSEAVGTLGDGR